jgi:hypothetical protein
LLSKKNINTLELPNQRETEALFVVVGSMEIKIIGSQRCLTDTARKAERSKMTRGSATISKTGEAVGWEESLGS